MTPSMATAPDATWECDHVGCSNGCTTRTGVCIPCLKARLGAFAASPAEGAE